MSDVADPIKLREKLAYGVGDFGNGIIFNATTIYLMFFYTEHLGLSAAQAGILLLVARLWDALIDPMMGVLADRTSSRWGRFRPWLAFVPLPLAVAAILAYTVPPLSPTGKLVWAYATHLTLMACYSAVNIPYGALPAAMTRSGVVRSELMSFRMSGSFLSGIAISLLFMPLAIWNDSTGHSASGGFTFAVAICAILAVAAHWTCFSGTCERVPVEIGRQDLRGDFRSVFHARAWWWLLLIGLVIFSLGIFPFYAGLYYLKYVAGLAGYSSAYFLAATLGMLTGALLTLFLVRRIERIRLTCLGSTLGALASASIFFVPPSSIALICVLTGASFIGIGIASSIVWSLVGDCANAIELETGRRLAGLTTSALSFSMKVGLGLGGALAGGVLAFTGFSAGTPPSISTATAMTMMISIVPALGHLVAALLAATFPITSQMAADIEVSLTKRRSGEI